MCARKTMIPTCFMKTLLPEEFGPVSTATPPSLQSLGTKLCVVNSANICLPYLAVWENMGLPSISNVKDWLLDNFRSCQVEFLWELRHRKQTTISVGQVGDIISTNNTNQVRNMTLRRLVIHTLLCRFQPVTGQWSRLRYRQSPNGYLQCSHPILPIIKGTEILIMIPLVLASLR